MESLYCCSNRADPGEISHYVTSHPSLHYFFTRHNWVSKGLLLFNLKTNGIQNRLLTDSQHSVPKCVICLNTAKLCYMCEHCQNNQHSEQQRKTQIKVG